MLTGITTSNGILDLNNLRDPNNIDNEMGKDLKEKLLLRIILYGALIYTMKIRDVNDPDSKFSDVVVPENQQNNEVSDYKNPLFNGNGNSFGTRFIQLNQFFDINNLKHGQSKTDNGSGGAGAGTVTLTNLFSYLRQHRK